MFVHVLIFSFVFIPVEIIEIMLLYLMLLLYHVTVNEWMELYFTLKSQKCLLNSGEKWTSNVKSVWWLTYRWVHAGNDLF